MNRLEKDLPESKEKDEESDYRVDEDIAFVLVYDLEKDGTNEMNKIRRRSFELNLVKNGLILSKVVGIQVASMCFVTVKIPWETLLTYADIMKLKMPLKSISINKPTSTFQFIMSYLPSIFELPNNDIFKETVKHLSVFRKDKINMFDITSKNTFFSMANKSLIANEILNRTMWGTSNEDIGIKRLIDAGVYITAYPLHEGKYKCQMKEIKYLTQRQILFKYWAHPRKFYKYQPIPLIRRYFGERIAMYYAWLGFYTLFLIPPTILGILGFIYSISNFGKDDISKHICNASETESFFMCPLCDQVCDYWRLSEDCIFFKLAHVFDNDFTIFFSIFMSLWGTMFIHFWIRRETELQFIWNTNGYEELEMVRQEFELNCNKKRLNPLTNEVESYMSFIKRLPRILLSILSVVIMVSFVVAIVIGCILFRVSIFKKLYNSKLPFISKYINIITSALAAFINLCAILLLNNIYTGIAMWLTSFENPRTETEYDNSFTLKMYSFQFLNFYASLFYIAFFKGTFIGRPGKYRYAFGWRQEECDPAGCMMELCIQMLVIFVGKQIMNNIFEYSIPFFRSKLSMKFYKFKHRANIKKQMLRLKKAIHIKPVIKEKIKRYENILVTNNSQVEQWEKDFYLVDSSSIDLFDEYLEMVIQFGFVTLFAAAMPLAPLFALLNNILEIRMDAYKMITRFRRPIPRVAQDIGIWLKILRTLSVVAVITNAFIISYTSNAIPRMVYRYSYNNEISWNLKGYVNFALSTFNISDFQPQNIPISKDKRFSNITTCRYRDFRQDPDSFNKYEFSRAYWHVLAVRLAFVIIFEHFIMFMSSLINWMVPHMSSSVKLRLEQEKLMNMKLLYESGTIGRSKEANEYIVKRSKSNSLTNVENNINFREL